MLSVKSYEEFTNDMSMHGVCTLWRQLDKNGDAWLHCDVKEHDTYGYEIIIYFLDGTDGRLYRPSQLWAYQTSVNQIMEIPHGF